VHVERFCWPKVFEVQLDAVAIGKAQSGSIKALLVLGGELTDDGQGHWR
jgi:hypothetical protein